MVRRATTAAVEKFLDYYEESRRLHRTLTGTPLREYKPTEPERLAEVFESLWSLEMTGVEFIGEVLHRLVWSQCLGNANHRTTILFLQAFLDSATLSLPSYAEEPNSDSRFRAAVNHFSDASHRILDRQSEFGYGPRQLERQHQDLTRRWITQQMGDQSRVAMTTGPQRLMTFCS